MDITFPARDEPLARIIAELSEPDAGRFADNLMTNEDSFASVVDRLQSDGEIRGVYLGVGPDQNLTYLAHARPSLAFVVDFRRRNALVHLLHKALASIAPDRPTYLSLLTARVPAGLPPDPSMDDLFAGFRRATFDRSLLAETVARVADLLGPTGLLAEAERPDLATIQAKLAGPGFDARFLALPMYPSLSRLLRSPDKLGRPAHFLAREEWYQVVREAELGDRVIPLVGDFAGPKTLTALGAWLRARGLAVATFYASDVEFFLLKAGRFAAYAANLAAIPWAADARLIRTSTREIDHPERRLGESSTTILRPIAPFLEAALAGRIATLDDLFR